MNSLYEAFLKSAEKYPDQDFIAVPPLPTRSYYQDGITFSYSEVADKVEELIDVYKRSGYGPGHRIGFLLENRPEYLMHFLAINALGMSSVPINPDYMHDEILYQMEHSEADLVIVIESRKDDIERVATECDKPLKIAVFESLTDSLPTPDLPAGIYPVTLETEACLLYTSGTTGRPKGCVLTNFYGLNAGQWYFDLGGLAAIREGQDRLYNPLPIFHMNAGVVSFCCMLISGGCMIVPDRFHPTSWWQEVCDTKATIIHYLGVVIPMLLNQPDNPLENQHHVRFGLGGGVEPELHELFEKRYGFPLLEVWGMTETGRIYCDCFEPREIDTRAFGKPLPGLEAKVVDDNDAEVARGTEGELLVRCSAEEPRKGFFKEYLKNPEATAEAWKGDWFHTGDTVIHGENDTLYFVDRKKNIIRRSGENIAAAEIEAAMQSHDAIAQIAIISVKDEVREEEVMACIVLMEGHQKSEQLARELFDFANTRLAYYKPPGWLLFVDSLPTTGTQKIQKTQIFPPDTDPRDEPGIFDFRKLKKKSR
jgi:acyl-CoA synthetase (AMP-forming)/AMP-acid ligase II